MPSNLSTIASVGTGATALANLIMVTPGQVIGYQPQGAASLFNQSGTPPTILFHYEGEQSVSLDSDITDHFVEDNTALQDQISLRPEVISTHGFVGELNDVAPVGLQTLKKVADKLTVINAYVPALSRTAINAYNEAFLAYQTASFAANAGVSALSSIAGSSQGSTILNQSTLIDLTKIQSKQQLYFQQFYGYWQSRVLFTVQTPWAVFSNCAIQSLRAVQDETTNVITDFNVTFKVMRFASTQTTTANPNTQGQLSSQSSPPANLGTSTPPPSIGVGQGLLNMGAPR